MPEDVGSIAEETIENQTESIADTEPAAQEQPEAGAEGDGQKAGESNEPEQKPADDWTLEAPEDFPLPEDNLKSFSEAAKKLGLTREQAAGMLNWHREFHNAVTGEAQQAWDTILSQWEKEIAQDREFGGANLKATVADARKALKYLDQDGSLRGMLKETGYDRNPAVIRVVTRAGRALAEHDFIAQNGEGKAAGVPLHERMYPNM